MATINVKDASGATVAVEKPNANGRQPAAASRPVVLSSEDKAVLDAAATSVKQDTIIGHVDGIEGSLAAILAKIIAAPATEAKQDALIAGLVGTEYETVAASQTTQSLGATGATGDLLTGVLIIPATTSPGAVAIKDGAGTAITVFVGGANSVSTLHPFFVPLGIRSGAGAWQVTTGANVSAIGVGNFS